MTSHSFSTTRAQWKAPVVLDPNTAHPQLVLSEDLTCMRLATEAMQLPDVPERFDQYACALASKGFLSGKHYWDVEVGEVDTWFLGVMPSSAKRKGWFSIQTEGLTLCRSDGEYRALSPSRPSVALAVGRDPRTIRVQLDWARGTLSFSDPHHGDDTHLHTFTHTFTERVFPYFMHPALRILPAEVAVTQVQ
ncbi:E3 ubiquitin-protein ligase TRIM39-like [Neoarius graeffei]|uniref:E3 ubiquitin-protein ligase TRIM39-like n=1 Tax=Neoarius graeffei TaxID=443677 RepID=UPI00298C1D5F|nr:E3 ubiquitin-protein ligase TRIM39-like [Neoarius graeffei]